MSTQILSGDFNVSMGERVQFRTLITPMESGKEQRRNKWAAPIRSFALLYKGRKQSRMQELWNFYTARQGSYDTFYFENINESPTSLSGDEAVGTGDGSDTTFNFDRFPVKSGDCTVTAGGSAQVEATDYTVTYTTGAIIFASAPGSGDAIVATSYKFYYICRFVDDYMDRELFSYKMYNGELRVQEVLQ